MNTSIVFIKLDRSQIKAELIPFEIEYPQNADQNVRIDRNV